MSEILVLVKSLSATSY